MIDKTKIYLKSLLDRLIVDPTRKINKNKGSQFWTVFPGLAIYRQIREIGT